MQIKGFTYAIFDTHQLQRTKSSRWVSFTTKKLNEINNAESGNNKQEMGVLMAPKE
jgi:hypothetical protein